LPAFSVANGALAWATARVAHGHGAWHGWVHGGRVPSAHSSICLREAAAYSEESWSMTEEGCSSGHNGTRYLDGRPRRASGVSGNSRELGDLRLGAWQEHAGALRRTTVGSRGCGSPRSADGIESRYLSTSESHVRQGVCAPRRMDARWVSVSILYCALRCARCLVVPGALRCELA